MTGSAGSGLVTASLVLDGDLIDLTEPEVRAELEDRHAALLLEHGLEHLDLHEITARRRAVTQSIAADPAPEPLLVVSNEWDLALEPTGDG